MYKLVDKNGNFVCRPANYSATDKQVNEQLTEVISNMNITPSLIDEEIKQLISKNTYRIPECFLLGSCTGAINDAHSNDKTHYRAFNSSFFNLKVDEEGLTTDDVFYVSIKTGKITVKQYDINYNQLSSNSFSSSGSFNYSKGAVYLKVLIEHNSATLRTINEFYIDTIRLTINGTEEYRENLMNRMYIKLLEKEIKEIKEIISNKIICESPDFHQSLMVANHRGYRANGAHENSLQAVIDSYKFGFRCVECDITWTSDGILVINHGTTSPSGLTIKNTDWQTLHSADPIIPTWSEYMLLCKKLGIKIYLDGSSGNYFEQFIEEIKLQNMEKNISFLGDGTRVLEKIPNARVGVVSFQGQLEASAALCKKMKTEKNDVFIDCMFKLSELTGDNSAKYKQIFKDLRLNNIGVEFWSINSLRDALTCIDNFYATGFTTDTCNIIKELRNSLV